MKLRKNALSYIAGAIMLAGSYTSGDIPKPERTSVEDEFLRRAFHTNSFPAGRKFPNANRFSGVELYAGIDYNGNGVNDKGDAIILERRFNFYKNDIVGFCGKIEKYGGHVIKWIVVDESRNQIVCKDEADWRKPFLNETFRCIGYFPVTDYSRLRLEQEVQTRKSIGKIAEEMENKDLRSSEMRSLKAKKERLEAIASALKDDVSRIRIYTVRFFIDSDPQTADLEIFSVDYGREDPFGERIKQIKSLNKPASSNRK